jgi:nicotinate-nucleotide pyrophosphorylase (carboxylating)
VQIKDNHLAAANGDFTSAVRRARELAPAGTRIEVECRSSAQVRQALKAGADVILLDAMSPAQVAECVELVGGRVETEVSGPIQLDSVRAFAQAGVDRIGVHALTQSAKTLDLALEFEAM